MGGPGAWDDLNGGEEPESQAVGKTDFKVEDKKIKKRQQRQMYNIKQIRWNRIDVKIDVGIEEKRI